MFITLEGPEGSGKTSQIPELVAFLNEKGLEVVTTREPGGTAIGDQIRKILTGMENQGMNPRSEVLLFLAARAQLVEQVINPALRDGRIVLCDRFGDSTIAYQGYGHDLDLQTLRTMLRFATGGLIPDLTLLLDLPVKAGLARKRKGQEWNRLDAYDVSFHERVRRGYHEMAVEEPDRWVILDATLPKEAVQVALREAVLKALENSESFKGKPTQSNNEVG